MKKAARGVALVLVALAASCSNHEGSHCSQCAVGCVDVSRDVANCGGCGHACMPGESCEGGACAGTCQDGLISCAGICTDPLRDRAYCGAKADCKAENAGEACPAEQVCADGSCSATCPEGEIDCAGGCVNPSSDPKRCGARGNCSSSGVSSDDYEGAQCGDGLRCQAGACAQADPCVGVVCQGGLVCVGGQCMVSCPTEHVGCGGECVDPANDPSHCGARGACSSQEPASADYLGAQCASDFLCVSGGCKLSCRSGQSACPLASPSLCSDLTGDPANCGRCGNVCSANQRCIAGACKGFWRLEQRNSNGNDRAWFMDPQGQRVFVLGVNSTMRKADCAGMDAYIRLPTPTIAARTEWARLSTGDVEGISYPTPLHFNSVGAWSEANDADATGGNSYMVRSVGDGGAGAPYTVVLDVQPKGDDRSLRNCRGDVLREGLGTTDGTPVGDPFNTAFLKDLDDMVGTQVTHRRNDTRLIAYYSGNELGIFDASKAAGSVRDLRVWLWSDCPSGSSIDTPFCAQHALAAFLRDRYGRSIADLNSAWGTSFATFSAAAASKPAVHTEDPCGQEICSIECRYDLQRFVHERLVPRWVQVITERVRAADPNHLVASPRLALSSKRSFRFWAQAGSSEPDTWSEAPTVEIPSDSGDVKYCPFDLFGRNGSSGFDLVGVNVYDGGDRFDGIVNHNVSPVPSGDANWFPDGIHKIMDMSGLPVMVSEFGIRADITGWSNKGGADSFVPKSDATEDQLQRGLHYQSQIDQLIAFRMIIGANWHSWHDGYVPGDPSKQMNKGLVRCDDAARGFQAGQPWGNALGPISDTNQNIMGLIEAKTGF